MTPELLALLRNAKQRAGGVKELARIMGVQRSRVSALVSGDSDYPPSNTACMRLAVAQKRDPIELLRMAGHAEDADLLAAYLRQRKNPSLSTLTDFERWLSAISGRLTQQDEALLKALIERILPETRPEQPRKRKASKSSR